MGDIKRIAGSLSRVDFYEYRTPLDPSYLSQEDDPVWAAQTIRRDGSRRVLKHVQGTNCIFLTEKGCQLDMQVRPLVCRLHPFTYTIAGVSEVLDQRCRQIFSGPDHELIADMSMSLELAEAWHQQLYEEIFFPEGVEPNEDWHHLRPAV
jgi:Fe-S-cluster containining protein